MGVGHRTWGHTAKNTELMKLLIHLGLLWWLSGKESAPSAEAAGNSVSIPGSRRSPGGGHGNPLLNSCPENPWKEEAEGLHSIGFQRVIHD